MNFFKIFFITLLLTIAGVSYADNHDQKKEVFEIKRNINMNNILEKFIW